MNGRGDRPNVPIPTGPDALGRPSRLGREVEVDEPFIRRLGGVCDSVDTSAAGRVAAGRDWWPVALVWAQAGRAPAVPAVVARPTDARQVAAVLRRCHEDRVPVTPVAGRSGVCGGSIPLHGGVALDLTGLAGLVDVDVTSLLVDVRAGTYGDTLEAELRSGPALTLGHWPQSIALSTVGGWLACRGAGQYSTRYGKIEDMVAGLEVALADGRLIGIGGRAPRAATGPDLTQVFVGSEGTLGVITQARLRVHPAPGRSRRAAYVVEDFAGGIDACRRVLRRGATPAVLRLHDPVESARSFGVEGGAVLVVIDEGDPALVDSTMAVVDAECAGRATPADPGLADRWLVHRNELPPLESLARTGIVADTIEVAARWSALPGLYRTLVGVLGDLDDTIAASAHQSHAYLDGACLYFTFAGQPAGDPEAYYRAAWDAVMAATDAAGGALSHHHGVGLNRGRYLRGHLGPAFALLEGLKRTFDPHGVLNPGKLGLPSPFDDPDEEAPPSASW
jgi:alkyldihydroxyacetonephosphate synthase